MKGKLYPLCRTKIHKKFIMYPNNDEYIKIFVYDMDFIFEKNIKLKNLTKHVFSCYFKNYLSYILRVKSNPYLTKVYVIHRTCFKFDKFFILSPLNIPYYNEKELMLMMRDNEEKFECNVHHKLVYKYKLKLIIDELSKRENELISSVIDGPSYVIKDYSTSL